MSGPVFKGTKGPVLLRVESSFNAETNQYDRKLTYRGDRVAISGKERQLQEEGIAYDITQEGPVFELVTRIPNNDPDILPLDKYEIGTGTTEIDIFQVPAVMAEAAKYDAAVAAAAIDGTPFYRTTAEAYATEFKGTILSDTTYPLWDKVVKHLKAKVTTFPVDYLILKRFRQVDTGYSLAPPGRFNLSDGLFIYTSAQLQLPPTVAFTLPDAPTNPLAYTELLIWGWRRKSQNLELVGNLMQQSVELEFGPWSRLYFIPATANLAW